MLSVFWVSKVAQPFGPNHACSYDCEGNAFFGVLLLVGLVVGIAAAATGTWARQRRGGGEKLGERAECRLGEYSRMHAP